MKRVLIITYYWPPSGGAGVQRWLKFAKYLRNFGWEPVIYTPENPEFPSTDLSFEKDIPENIEVVKTPIWEPYNVYRNLFKKKGETINAGFISEQSGKTWKDKLSIWIRGNFLIPDPRRFWVRPSVKFLTRYLKENQIDAIVTTGPPHSMHMIGLGLKKTIPQLPWVADFRDPWTGIDFYEDLHLTKIADYIHHRWEKKVIQHTDCLIGVSPSGMIEFEKLHPKKTKVIINGYDETDVSLKEVQLDDKFSISHIGTLNEARNSPTLWRVLQKMCNENSDFAHDLKIQLIGKIDFSVIESIKQQGLEANLEKTDYVTHDEAIEKQQSSQVLLLLINNTPNAKGILTGKFFEYLASKRPILAIGCTDGDVAEILHETNAGKMVDFEDERGLEEILWTYYNNYKRGGYTENASADVEQFSRKNLTKQLAALLNELTENK